MKAHKYWSFASFICMLLACWSGSDKPEENLHKYWALGSLGCMIMSIWTGHKMVIKHHGKKTTEAAGKKKTAGTGKKENWKNKKEDGAEE